MNLAEIEKWALEEKKKCEDRGEIADALSYGYIAFGCISLIQSEAKRKKRKEEG